MVFKKQRISTGIEGCEYAPIQGAESNQTSRAVETLKAITARKTARYLWNLMCSLRVFRRSRINAGSCFEKRSIGTRPTWGARSLPPRIITRASTRIQMPLYELPIYRSFIISIVAATAFRILKGK